MCQIAHIRGGGGRFLHDGRDVDQSDVGIGIKEFRLSETGNKGQLPPIYGKHGDAVRARQGDDFCHRPRAYAGGSRKIHQINIFVHIEGQQRIVTGAERNPIGLSRDRERFDGQGGIGGQLHRALRLKRLDGGVGIDSPQLMLLIILLDDIVGAVALLTRLAGFVGRLRRGKYNPLAILRPLKLIDVGLRFGERPGFAAIRSDDPDLLCGRLCRGRGAFAVLLCGRIFLDGRIRFDDVRLALGNEGEPAAVRGPCRRCDRFLAARQLHRFAAAHIDPP